MINALHAFFLLNGQVTYWIFVAPFKGKPIRPAAVVQQMVKIGVQAIPMTALTSLSIGLTLAMQAAGELGLMGATDLVPQLIGMSLLRELGPLLVGVVVIGRSGSAVTAEIGTMKVSEEIEALEAMAINPVRYLVVPRFLAMLIMLPVITVFGIYIGIVGGWTICFFAIGMGTELYVLRILESVSLVDLWSGMLKSLVFAWLIISIACETGLAVRGGAEGVGKATTQSVVKSIIAMLIANAILTAAFFLIER